MSPSGLLVAEIFGPSFQGEGPSCGKRAAFVRLSRCNLTCSWCDTPYTWDTTHFDLSREATRLSARYVLARLRSMAAALVVITGGEPLLQQRLLVPLVQACRDEGWSVEVETNGTVTPAPALCGLVSAFNVSPKLANAGLARERRLRPDVLRGLADSGKAVFKFVVEGPEDLAEIAALEADLGLAPIWVMPQGEAAETTLAVMASVADEVLARGWSLTTRLHVLLWGAARGR